MVFEKPQIVLTDLVVDGKTESFLWLGYTLGILGSLHGLALSLFSKFK